MDECEPAARSKHARDDVTRLWLCRSDIISQVRPHDVIDHLRQDGILSESDQELVMFEKTTNRKMTTLLELILSRGHEAGDVFLSALQENCEHVYRQLLDTVVTDKNRRRFLAYLTESEYARSSKGKLISHSSAVRGDAVGFDEVDEGHSMSSNITRDFGDIIGTKVRPDIMPRLRGELRDFYQHELRSFRPVPWNDELVLEMADFYRDLTLVDVTKKQSTAQSGQSQGPRESQVKEVADLSKLFNDGPHTCRRILIEGEPGVGKSTFCKKMALDWATPQPGDGDGDGAKWVHSFDQLVLLSAGEFRDSLAASIMEAILSEDVTGIPRDRLELELLDTTIQERTLLILDAYDEAHDRDLIRDVWNGTLLRRCTVVITTRLSQTGDLLKKVDKRYVIQGFSAANRDSFIEQYACESGCDDKLLENMKKVGGVMGHMTSVPLYVSLLCMLLEESPEIPSTRTKLLSEVMALAEGTISSKQGKSLDEIQEQMAKLSQFAFDTLCNPREASKNQALWQNFQQLGFVVAEKGKSKLRPVLSVRFVHKIFQEYLAARYLAKLGFDDMLERINLLSREDKRNVVIFLAGLLSARPGSDMRSFFAKLVCINMRLNTHVIRADDHDMIHHGVQCLAESGIFDGLVDLLPKVVPRYFFFNSEVCSHCLCGLLVASQINPNYTDIAFDVLPIALDRSRRDTLKRDLADAQVFQAAVFRGDFCSDSLVQEMLFFYSPVLAALRHLYVYCSECPFPAEPFLESCLEQMPMNLSSLLIRGSTQRHLTGAEFALNQAESLLVGLLNALTPSLRCLVLEYVTIRGESYKTFHEKMKVISQCLQAFVMVDVSFNSGNNLENTLSMLNTRNLKHLEIVGCCYYDDADPNASKDVDLVSTNVRNVSHELPCVVFTVIRENILQTLVIRHQTADWSLLQPSLERSLTTLTYLDLSETTWDDPGIFCGMSSVFNERKLSTLILQSLKVDSLALVEALKQTRYLAHLDLSCNLLGGEDTFPFLCECLAQNPNLRQLSLAKCGITDDTLGYLHPVLDQVNLEEVNLEANDIISSDDTWQVVNAILTNATSLTTLMLPVACFTKRTMQLLVECCQMLPNLISLSIVSRPSADIMQEFRACAQSDDKNIINKMLRLLPHLKLVNFGMSHDFFRVKRSQIYDTNTGHARFREICLKYKEN